MTRTKKLVFIALLVAQALVLHVIEGMLPINFGIPGAKLGLANIITLTALYFFSFKEVLSIVVLKTIMTMLVGGSVSGFLYSLSGGLLSLVAMYIMYRFGRPRVSIIGISVMGAVFHNLGQLLMAAFIIQNIKIVFYLPLLIVSAVGTGIFVGLASKYMIVGMEKTGIPKRR
jgi:heptaprenyl diphosphate synthase